MKYTVTPLHFSNRMNLRRLLEIKQRQKEEEAMHIEDTQRLVAEIEMLKVVLYLVTSDDSRRRAAAFTIIK